MSMLVRKGTMLHRSGRRGSTTAAAGRRASVASASPSSRRASLVPSPRHSLTPGVALPLTPPVTAPSPRTSPRSSLTVSTCEDERRRSSNAISVDDHRRLCSKEQERSFKAFGSILYQVREANDESTGILDFVARAIKIVGTSALVTVLLICLCVLPLLMLIMGVQYRQECPKEPNIPIYLLVGGAFGLIKMGLTLWRQMRSRQPLEQDFSDLDEPSSMSLKITDCTLNIFLMTWFALGNYWILHIYKPNFVPPLPYLLQPNDWCDRTVYVFALAQLGTCYAVVALALTAIIMLILYAKLCNRN